MFEVNEDVCEIVGVDSIESSLKGFYEGGTVEIFVDGMRSLRRVRDSRGGLYVVIRGCKVFYEDFE